MNSFPNDVINYAGYLFFSADDGDHGFELWKTDGGFPGTMMLNEIYPGPGNAYPYWKIVFDSSLFFIASDSAHGQEIWTYTIHYNDAPFITSRQPVLIFPNPSKGNFNVDVSQFRNQNLTISLIDPLGKLIQQEQVLDNSYDFLPFNCQACRSQLYFLILRANSGSIVLKIMIDR